MVFPLFKVIGAQLRILCGIYFFLHCFFFFYYDQVTCFLLTCLCIKHKLVLKISFTIVYLFIHSFTLETVLSSFLPFDLSRTATLGSVPAHSVAWAVGTQCWLGSPASSRRLLDRHREDLLTLSPPPLVEQQWTQEPGWPSHPSVPPFHSLFIGRLLFLLHLFRVSVGVEIRRNLPWMLTQNVHPCKKLNGSVSTPSPLLSDLPFWCMG